MERCLADVGGAKLIVEQGPPRMRQQPEEDGGERSHRSQAKDESSKKDARKANGKTQASEAITSDRGSARG